MTAISESTLAAPEGAAAPVPTTSSALPAGIAELFARPVLAHNEDREAYETWLHRVARAVGPQDIFEWIMLRDYADLAWDVLRLRRAKGGMLRRARVDSLTRFVTARAGLENANKLFFDPQLEAASLATMGMDAESFAASATIGVLDQLEQIERLIATAETRRDAVLKRIDDHRHQLGQRLRKAAGDVIDAEFEDVPASEAPAQPSEPAAA